MAPGTDARSDGVSVTALGAPAAGALLFDLNIEEVLENWEVHHAIREVIANALDEHVLSNSAPPEIVQDADGWHIRDFGRGVRIQHFTQNENPEKLSASGGVIGKFGVGLKDALATFHRNGVDVSIRSAHGAFRLATAEKRGFSGITTLHVVYDPGETLPGVGTDVRLKGVTTRSIDDAKALFLRFSGERVLERTDYGEILARGAEGARVYINGVYANDEPNFLFSYNITSLTPAMRKRLNRERVNVGRTTYTERIVAILKQAQGADVRAALGDQALRTKGEQCDEMQWIEVSQLAFNFLHDSSKVTFVTERELEERPDMIDQMRRDGYRVVIVGEAQRARLQQQVDTGGPVVHTFDQYVSEYNASFQYTFVEPEALTPQEREVFDLTPRLLALVGVSGRSAPRVRISETIRADRYESGAVWDPLEGIIIKRSELTSARGYAAVLLHETAHATSFAMDATREFEGVLTDYLGMTGTAALGLPRTDTTQRSTAKGSSRQSRSAKQMRS